MKVIKISAIGSTNEYLKSLAKNSLVDDQTLVYTEHQTEGKGQMGSQWFFEIGKSLAFSIFKRFYTKVTFPAFYVNMAVSLGVKKGLESIGIPKVAIKWPNDILADGKKVGGILVENQFQKGQISTSVIGIGININNESFPNFPQASSLLINTGVHFASGEVMNAIYHHVIFQLDRLHPTSMAVIKQEYENFLFRKGIISTFQDPLGQRFNGIICGVTDEGFLEIQVGETGIQRFRLKELQLLY